MTCDNQTLTNLYFIIMIVTIIVTNIIDGRALELGQFCLGARTL